MPKYITKIYSEHLKVIGLGEGVFNQSALGDVSDIVFNPGSHEGESYTESYEISFKDNEKTLEVFDVVYVIRDELK